MRVYASKLLGSPDVETLPPPAQWAVLEAAYTGIGAASVGNVVPLLLILLLPALTGALWPPGWFAATLCATAGGWFAARKFGQVASGAPVAFHVRRFTPAAAAQMAVLGAGGVAAVGIGSAARGHLESCALAALPISFAMMNVCATARVARAARLQAGLLGAPMVAAIVVQLLRGQGVPGYTILACVFSVWAVGAALLAREAVARNHLFALRVLQGGRAAAPTGMPPGVSPSETFQQLHGRDQVTGLLNGYRFAHVLAQEAERAAVAELPLSLILLDWDGYESFAARRTPQETSARLLEIAQRMRGALRRRSDEIARIGDCRFGIVLAGTDAFGANIVAQNLVAALNRTPGDAPAGPVAAPVQLSIGIASYCGRGLLPETQLMQFAGDALRHAKVNGGSQIRRHDDAAHAMRPATEKLPKAVPPYDKVAPGPMIDGTRGATTLSIGHALEHTK